MNGFYVLLAIILLGLFAGIFFFTQKDSIMKTTFESNNVDILPSGSDVFKAIAPTQSLKQESPPVQTIPTYSVQEEIKASYSATISTTKGDITINLDGQNAPKTVSNFLSKAKSGFYNNLTFHRVEEWVIQGGDPNGNGTGGGIMQTELNNLPFIEGSIGVARGGDINISNDSQFFITKKEASWLNGQYTNFGTVTQGIDIVNKIQIGDKILSIKVN